MRRYSNESLKINHSLIGGNIQKYNLFQVPNIANKRIKLLKKFYNRLNINISLKNVINK